MNALALLTFTAAATLTTARQLLPRNMRSVGLQHYDPLRQHPLEVRYLNEEDPMESENSPFRKHSQASDLPIIILKNLKYPKMKKNAKISDEENLGFILQKPLKRVRKLKLLPKRLRSESPYDSLFDKNGMLFLTPKKDSEDRKLNTLMNKVVKFKMDEKKIEHPRRPSSVFKKDELDRLRTIVDAINGNDEAKADTTPKVVFDFNELVL